MTTMCSNRKPYPFPTFENDDKFAGSQQTMKEPYCDPTHIAQQQEPWGRLNSAPTLSSSRRDVFHHDPQAPRDSLDFVLKAKYNHHDEFLRDKNETLYQPETLGLDHGRTLKKREKEQPKVEYPLNHPLRIYETPKKQVIHSMHNAIAGHHTQATNKGFTRKHDGGYFTA
ncbi:protein CFAP276-like isoform X3 [Lineus longissimus]|uniref:protein CFAP276-like isoform X3 n=1 Tax=Lineus longissimus TaxID=88925 RepID=UPI002B4E1F76